jgi:phage gpG-like protein
MIEASLKPAQVAKARRNIEGLAQKLTNPLVANKAAGIQLYNWTIRNFDAEGAYQRPVWRDLAPSTKRRKAREGKERMLVRTGHMRAGIVPFWSRDNAGVGVTVSYSVFHEEGTDRMPQRKILPRAEVVVETGMKVYGHYVATATREANR